MPDLPHFEDGGWWVQDPAAAAAAAALDAALPRRARVLDACAAPGGKALQLAARGHAVVAVEVSARRAARLRENARRCRLDVDIRVEDARTHGGAYDGVLLDAPCSATGTARRRPDVLAKAGADAALVATQEALLAGAWAALKPGGVLVFSSCSAFKADAEHAVASFVAATPDAARDRVDPADLDAAFDAAAFTDRGDVRLWPWHHAGGCDAHYLARLTKAPH